MIITDTLLKSNFSNFLFFVYLDYCYDEFMYRLCCDGNSGYKIYKLCLLSNLSTKRSPSSTWCNLLHIGNTPAISPAHKCKPMLSYLGRIILIHVNFYWKTRLNLHLLNLFITVLASSTGSFLLTVQK